MYMVNGSLSGIIHIVAKQPYVAAVVGAVMLGAYAAPPAMPTTITPPTELLSPIPMAEFSTLPEFGLRPVIVLTLPPAPKLPEETKKISQ